MVRAKFKCVSNDNKGTAGDVNNENADIRLEPVYGTSEENKSFFKWTPSGVIQLNCINPAANKQFKVGKEYYVDFTPAN